MRNILGCIGVGNMGGAILHGILNAGVFSPEQLILSDISEERCVPFTALGCRYIASPLAAAEAADAILLAVKPQQLDAVLASIAPAAYGKLFISIAAGVTVGHIRSLLPGASVIRVMPNTPLQVAAGVSALAIPSDTDPEDRTLVQRIFSASGMAFETDEALINPVTAVTSSSIAYFSRMIGDMCAWARQNGFTDDKQILEMVCQSAIGTAELLRQTELDPAALERAVTSPGGTTERAMAVFTAEDASGILGRAMDACRVRADQLSGN